MATLNPRIVTDHLNPSDPVSFIPMAAVAELSGQVDLSQTRSLTSVSKGYTRFQDGDVLFAKITPCMENGKIAVAENLVNGVGFGSTEFHVFRAHEGIEPKYLFYFLTQQRVRNDAEHNMKGTAGQKRVPASYFETLEIPIPPSAEQKRIVAALEVFFAGVDSLE